MGKWLENRYFFVTPPRGMAARAEPWPLRRRPPNVAPEVQISGPTERCQFPDFYASANRIYHSERVSTPIFSESASRDQDKDA